MTVAEKRELVRDACITIKRIALEHPQWAAAINFAVYMLVLEHKLPKKYQPWLVKPKRKKRGAKKCRKD